MAMVDWVEAGMGVVDGMIDGQGKGVGRLSDMPEHIPSAR